MSPFSDIWGNYGTMCRFLVSPNITNTGLFRFKNIERLDLGFQAATRLPIFNAYAAYCVPKLPRLTALRVLTRNYNFLNHEYGEYDGAINRINEALGIKGKLRNVSSDGMTDTWFWSSVVCLRWDETVPDLPDCLHSAETSNQRRSRETVIRVEKFVQEEDEWETRGIELMRQIPLCQWREETR
jgi:hypothetical protein